MEVHLFRGMFAQQVLREAADWIDQHQYQDLGEVQDMVLTYSQRLTEGQTEPWVAVLRMLDYMQERPDVDRRLLIDNSGFKRTHKRPSIRD